ncbi:Fe-S oxidoreductase [Marinobacterium iners]|jgi:L-lactate dehydrogenase complex protein LldE|uniref:L-lactate dehydrogenase complex protein LldE n=1 Tax=Marinobacterium iners DSM 11526 TaxID=1122198 RepID=A0A1H3XEM7_9GAMM|nr:(Fe-S)-binding protein [Marinobacterium iners]QSR34134.1 Fe-S oxidoreductase [Marinobacterium iners]SDZ97072.1 L-lactate dehydrogenase complex protein LldE [Marinobacterium iners DSM 11526]
MSDTQTMPIKVGLFVTCLADMFRPEVAFATVKLLEQAGCEVEVPRNQTCCGQPAFNSGDKHNSRTIARQTIEALEGYRYVVGPSGSCIGMLHHYPELFTEDDPWKARAEALKARAFEVTSFLVDVLNFSGIQSEFNGKITYHDSCSGLRELGIKQQPRQLLSEIDGVELAEMQEAETCCGFGGTFCVKYPDISNRMVSNKTGFAADSGASTLVGGDLGCLLNMAGKLKREGREVQVRHVVELLADMTGTPAIGEADYDLGQPL